MRSHGLIAPAIARRWLADGGEIAFIDVREEGLFGLGHPLLASNIPYSRLELEIGARVPRRSTRILLVGDDDGIVGLAAARLSAIGYGALDAVQGGIGAWAEAGLALFEGVNVPSKAFAELVEHAFRTPSISAAELQKLRDAKADFVLLDSRAAEEYGRFHVPGARNCPGAELAYRIDDLVARPDTLIVVSCAGRTRGIMGAQSLISAGVSNRVVALAGGTQGWRLAGLQLESGPSDPLPVPSAPALAAAARRAERLAARHGIGRITTDTLQQWRGEGDRTTYVFDVRTPEEYRRGHLACAVSAPGGQLLQATDQWAATWGARMVLVDDDGVRATVTAHWLRQMGWEVAVLAGSFDAVAPAEPAGDRDVPEASEIAADAAPAWLGRDGCIVSVGPSADYRAGHPAGALWINRSRVAAFARRHPAVPRVLVVGATVALANLVALDLSEIAAVDARVLAGGFAAWTDAGLPVESSPEQPPDQERMDFLFWNHDRHQGNHAAMRAYLDWERDLPAQVARDGTARFDIRP
jgi:rhodanese-related sulfurtransferase